jgi:hypothetical protein
LKAPIGIVAILGASLCISFIAWRALRSSSELVAEKTESNAIETKLPLVEVPLHLESAPVTIAKPPASDALNEKDAEVVKTIHARFATGDFVGALNLADQYLTGRETSDALHKWIMDQMPALLTSAGWTKLRLGACEDAIGYFRRSDVIRKSPEATKGLALCHYKQKNYASAREHFDAYLEKNPSDQQMRILLTDVLESEGSYDQAVGLLEKTVAEIETLASHPDSMMPDVDTLKNRLKGMRTKAAVSKHQNSEVSQNFRLSYSAGDHEDLVAFVLSTLEEALDEYIENYGFLRPINPIEVILYDGGNFRNVVAGGPEWAEGIFDGRLRIPVREQMQRGQTGGLKTILRHELTHALTAIASDNRTLPPWFEEGLAQKLSCQSGECGNFMFPPTPGGFLPANSFNTSYISLASDKAGRAYTQSLYLIYTLQKLQGNDVIRTIVSQITTNSDTAADGILKPTNLSFESLHAEASRLWEGQTVLP